MVKVCGNLAANLICMVKVCGNLAVLARRMTTFLTANQNIDTSVQKGGVPGFSGCFEHTSAISQIIHEAKVNNKELTVIWLDLDNSYGSIPHTLIDEALLHPRTYTGDRQWLFWWLAASILSWRGDNVIAEVEKGIVTGCTISVVRHTRSTKCNQLYTPKPNCKLFRKSFIYSGATIWNSLPLHV